ncbi:MAG: PHB depolymerase family esterase [Paracoccaceae bacterium]
MRILYSLAAAIGLAYGSPVVANACGTGEQACEVADGSYFVAMPEGEPTGLVLWLHGAGGSGSKAAANEGFTRNFREAGLVFVAPQGEQVWPNGKVMRDWSVADGIDDSRDDVAFLSAVVADAVNRFELEGKPLLLAGFSRGGSMAWDLACARPDLFDAVAPVAGGFWEPMERDCAAPVHIFHTHGFSDRMVPLEGRQGTWQGFHFHQGNILKGLDIWRETNGCLGAADEHASEEGLWQKRWTGCAGGSITLQITPRGHGIPKGWSGRVLEWFDSVTEG